MSLEPLLLFPIWSIGLVALGPFIHPSEWMLSLDPFSLFSLFLSCGAKLGQQRIVSLNQSSLSLFPWSAALFFVPCLPIPIGSQGFDA